MALRIVNFNLRPLYPQAIRCCSTASQGMEEFRVLSLRPINTKRQERSKRTKKVLPPPRFHRMATDGDWGAVWPAPRSFHPASVPFPVRQGFTEGGKAAPDKFANAELMKIPNFLHLTPPVVKRQCEALKKFCTPWPKGLETDEKIEKHFPIRVISSDYCLSSPSIRNALARVVAIKVKMARLGFDEHATDKFLRLVKERYDTETDEVTIVSDRCPLKKQNYDYVYYLLTALCHESRRVEAWEALKSVADMEVYEWKRNKSAESSTAILSWGKLEKQLPSQNYITAIERFMNEGENQQTLDQYRDSVLEILLSKPPTTEIKTQASE